MVRGIELCVLCAVLQAAVELLGGVVQREHGWVREVVCLADTLRLACGTSTIT